MSKVRLSFQGNLGYAPDQVKSSYSLGDLLAEVEQAISDYGDDADVVVYQLNNRGANYGNLVAEYSSLFEPVEDDE